MNILIAAIGKFKPQDKETALINTYLERMSWNIKLVSHPHEVTKSAESRALMSLSQSRHLIALDTCGKEMSSKEFANLLERLQLQSINNLTFAIGGAYGHDDALLKKSYLVLSLSKMTLPHKLARVMLVEQIYRAYTILNNHPYNT